MNNLKRPLTEAELDKIWETESNTDESVYLSSEESDVEINLQVNDSSSSDSSDNDFENETILPSNSNTLVSKNKKETWFTEQLSANKGRLSNANILKEKSGPSRFAKREIDSIKQSFLIYLRQPLLEIVCKWTNAEGKRVYKDQWKPIDINELIKFIGVLILVGVYKSKNEEISQLWSEENGRIIFRKLMSRNRFQQILRVIRFDNAEYRRKIKVADKLLPIREIFELWNKYLRDAYIPDWFVTVDEQLLTFRGRSPFTQYIPSKPGSYGLKFWVLCDSTNSYAWKLIIHAGKEGKNRQMKVGETVVKELVKEIELSGRNVTTDNFFTSLDLARYLLTKKLTVVGTIRKNKGELSPSFVVTKHRIRYSTLFGFQKDATVVSYCPKKNKVVTLLSTLHNDAKVDTNSEKKKPQIILDYNKTKCGVDTMDQMVKVYSVKRMTRRWPLAVFYNMIDISAMNAYKIWQMITSEKLKRRNFLISLGKQLGGIEPSDDTTRPLCSGVTRHSSEEEPPKRRRCHMCPPKIDKKIKSCCKNCKKIFVIIILVYYATNVKM